MKKFNDEEYGCQVFQGFLFSLLVGIIYLGYLGVSSIYNNYQEKQEMEIARQERKEERIRAEKEAKIKATKERSKAQEFAESCGFEYNSSTLVMIFDFQDNSTREGYLFENENEYFVNGVVINKADFCSCDRYNSIVIKTNGKYCPALTTFGPCGATCVVQYSDGTYDKPYFVDALLLSL